MQSILGEREPRESSHLHACANHCMHRAPHGPVVQPLTAVNLFMVNLYLMASPASPSPPDHPFPLAKCQY